MGEALLDLILFLVLSRALSKLLGGVMAGLRTSPREAPRPAARGSVHMERDPVCGTFVIPDRAVALTYRGDRVYFCSAACRDQYRRNAPGGAARSTHDGVGRAEGRTA